MFVRWSLGLQTQKLHNRNPFAPILELRPTERGYANLYARLANEGGYLPTDKGESRNDSGQNAHNPIGLCDISGTFKSAGSQNRGNQSHRKRVWI
jgi:hypothetical protein